MEWIIGIVVLVVIIMLFVRWSNSIEGMSKTVAKVMRASLVAIQGQYDYPIDTNQGKIQLYSHVLRTRPGYRQEIIDDILDEAIALTKARGSNQISFNRVVYMVVVREYTLAKGARPTKDQVHAIMRTVDSILQ